MHTAKVTSKGQITIPGDVRRAMRLGAGSEVMFFPNEEGDFIIRARTGSIRDLRGCLAGYGAPRTDEEMNEILHRRAQALDEASKTGARPVSDGEAA